MSPDVCRSATGDLASYPRYHDKITAVQDYGLVAIPRLRRAPQADLPVRHRGAAGVNLPVMELALRSGSIQFPATCSVTALSAAVGDRRLHDRQRRSVLRWRGS